MYPYYYPVEDWAKDELERRRRQASRDRLLRDLGRQRKSAQGNLIQRLLRALNSVARRLRRHGDIREPHWGEPEARAELQH